jgi:hypothetical protein
MSLEDLVLALEGRVPVASHHLVAARREQVAPLLGARGRTADDRLRHELDRELRANLARGIVLERELARAAERLHAQGLPVLLLKGAALTRLLYGPGERFMTDVDILVPARRWSDAVGALLAAGYRLHNPTDRPLTLAHYYNYPLITPGGVLLEVHRRLCGWPLFDVDHAGLFERARQDGDGLLVPDPADLFVTLGVHAAKHGWTLPLRSYLDGRLLLRSGAVDRGVVLARARAWKVLRATRRWLQLIDLPAAIPPARGSAALWWRIVRASDGPLRPLVWAGSRLAYRVADRGYRLWRDRVGA